VIVVSKFKAYLFAPFSERYILTNCSAKFFSFLNIKDVVSYFTGGGKSAGILNISSVILGFSSTFIASTIIFFPVSLITSLPRIMLFHRKILTSFP
jgi:hypothetical protein